MARKRKRRRDRRKIAPPPSDTAVLRYRATVAYYRADGGTGWLRYRSMKWDGPDRPRFRARHGLVPAGRWIRERFADSGKALEFVQALKADPLVERIELRESVKWVEPKGPARSEKVRTCPTIPDRAMLRNNAESGIYGRFWAEHAEWIG